MDRRERAKINSANASRQGRNTFWTIGRIEFLRRRAADGLFAAAIGNELGCSKNAVVSKALRCQITLTGYADYLTAVRQRNARANAEAIKARIIALQEQLATKQKPKPRRVSRETETVSA